MKKRRGGLTHGEYLAWSYVGGRHTSPISTPPSLVTSKGLPLGGHVFTTPPPAMTRQTLHTPPRHTPASRTPLPSPPPPPFRRSGRKTAGAEALRRVVSAVRGGGHQSESVMKKVVKRGSNLLRYAHGWTSGSISAGYKKVLSHTEHGKRQTVSTAKTGLTKKGASLLRSAQALCTQSRRRVGAVLSQSGNRKRRVVGGARAALKRGANTLHDARDLWILKRIEKRNIDWSEIQKKEGEAAVRQKTSVDSSITKNWILKRFGSHPKFLNKSGGKGSGLSTHFVTSGFKQKYWNIVRPGPKTSCNMTQVQLDTLLACFHSFPDNLYGQGHGYLIRYIVHTRDRGGALRIVRSNAMRGIMKGDQSHVLPESEKLHIYLQGKCAIHPQYALVSNNITRYFVSLDTCAHCPLTEYVLQRTVYESESSMISLMLFVARIYSRIAREQIPSINAQSMRYEDVGDLIESLTYDHLKKLRR